MGYKQKWCAQFFRQFSEGEGICFPTPLRWTLLSDLLWLMTCEHTGHMTHLSRGYSEFPWLTSCALVFHHEENETQVTIIPLAWLLEWEAGGSDTAQHSS